MSNIERRLRWIEARLRVGMEPKAPGVLTYAHPFLPANGKTIFNTAEEMIACYPNQFRCVVAGFSPDEWAIAVEEKAAKEKGS